LVGNYQRFTEADLTRLRASGCQHRPRELEGGLGEYYRALREADGYRS
jgi:hypothetical protein